MNRYDDLSNFVKPVQSAKVIELPPSDAPATNVDGVWLAQPGADERTSGMDRSKALVFRLLPFTVLWGLMAIAVCVYLVMSLSVDKTNAGVLCLIAFVLVTAYTYIKLDSQERYDSKHGVEHHKIDSATYLAEKKMDLDHEVRKQLIAAYLKQLEDGNNGTRQLGGESGPTASRKQLPNTRQSH